MAGQRPRPEHVRTDAECATQVDALYRAHRDAVYAFLYNFCRNRQEAEDLLQDTFLKAHRALLGGECQ